MILRLTGLAGQQVFSIETGEYSPLRIEFEPRVLSLDEVYYWRSTNKTYLLEIKLHASSGALAEINLVLIPEQRIIRAESIPEFHGLSEKKDGLPCFEITPWTDRIAGKEIGIDPALRRFDEDCPFKFFHSNSGVAILFDGCVPDYLVLNHQLRFLFDSNNDLCGLVVPNIPKPKRRWFSKR